MSMAWVLIAQVMASSAMAAIAWFVQEVHYPLFARVSDGSDASAPGGKTGAAALDYHAENLRRTRPIVLVPMVVEAATATWLAVFPPAAVGRAPTLVGLALVAAVILSTGLVQVPLHAALRDGVASSDTIDRLVRSTRWRTVVWTARSLLAAWMLHASQGSV
jgi:hypothetical protein